MGYTLPSILINLVIFYFFLKDDKFYPAMAKFYWTLIIIFIPFGWLVYITWGRKKYALKGKLFDYKNNDSLSERE
jgi:ABC-type microcin C transport system permease subunit YejE